MFCQNCGKDNANVKYTQIINGVKKEMVLCENCAKELGIDKMNFSMPIDFSSFLGDFFEEPISNAGLLGGFYNEPLKCNTCGLTYDDFTHTGKFGCSDCYNAFERKLDSILKNLHGSNRYVGRRLKENKSENVKVNIKNIENQEKEETKLEKMKRNLNKAIQEERYEDAAKIRDEIKKIDKQ